MATCKSCNAPIIWAETPNGRPMPVDDQPSLKGTLFLMTRLREAPLAIHHESTVPFAQGARNLDSPRYVSHFSSCPNAAKHRKAR